MTRLASIVRLHIVLIAMAAMLVFGWLFTGAYLWPLAIIVGVDWFFINIENRVTDAAEDVVNEVPGAAEVARARRWLEPAVLGGLAASFALTHWLYPALWPYRLAVHVVGLAYSYRLIPTRRGWVRMKELYFWKNSGSAGLFIVTCILYPWLASGLPAVVPTVFIATLIGFFPLYELTYEIIYDLRDLPGDRAEGIPTYPVVHGEAASVRIVHALLVASAGVLVGGALIGAIGVRELLMLVAPALQAGLLRRWLRHGITHGDCIRLTHLGTALLLLFLAGTAVWREAGLPANLFIRDL